MSKNRKLIPELRFPEFKNEGEWNIEPLGNLSDEIVEKTRGRKYKLMSITSGIGLVSQIEKFGREIAGDSYKNYYVIHNGDFAYNKSSTKLYGEGEIAMYEDTHMGAVPNSIFTCFRFDQNKIYSPFAKYPFANNLHGNWLKKFIAIGARANGALQVNAKDLFSLPFPHPALNEQKKIASCLSSSDEMIFAHSQKLELLKNHKKGLMQNLFPRGEEKVPKYRFPEFMTDGKWVKAPLEKISNKIMVGIASAATHAYRKSGVILLRNQNIKEGYLDDSDILFIDEEYEKAHKNKRLKIGDLLTARTGYPGTTCVVTDKYEGTQSFTTLITRPNNKSIDSNFLCYYINSEAGQAFFESAKIGGGQKNVNAGSLSEMPIRYPSLNEQRKIASCLSSLDALITTQIEKITQLKLHKKALIQGLFPNMND